MFGDFEFDIEAPMAPSKGFSQVEVKRKESAKDLAVAQRMVKKEEPKFLKAQREQNRKAKSESAEKHVAVRKFHNTIKGGLYKKAYDLAGLNDRNVRSRKTLLELACGRGGDMHKWKKTGYQTVLAVDNDSAAIDQARERFKNVDSRPLRAQFEFLDLAADDLMTVTLSDKFPKTSWFYDTVSIQFAIQYMCKTQQSLVTFLSWVSSLVAPGGTFVGSYPDGGEIRKLLGADRVFDNGFLKIREREDGFPGLNFHADFGGSSSYFDAFGTSEEYPVIWSDLRGIMELMGFVLKEHSSFLDYPEAEAFYLLPEERQFSGVFKSFIFQKHPKTTHFPVIPKCVINWDALQIDKVGTYSVTRPRDATKMHHAIYNMWLMVSEGKKCGTVCDGTACVGGDTIQFAQYASQVFAWEIDRGRYEMLVNNLGVYGLSNVACYNSSIVMYGGTADILYLDPPWGGPKYSESDDVELYLDGMNVKDLVINLKERFVMIVVKVPFNFKKREKDRVVNITNKISLWFP